MSQKPVESYGVAVSHFRKIRNNFHGTTVYYYKAQMNYKLGDIAPYHQLGGFRLSHKHLAFADLQVPIMLAEHFNFTFSTYRDHILEDMGDGSNLGALFCRVGAFTHGDGFAQSDDVEGLALSIFFEGFSYFNAFYTDDDGDDLSPIPFKLKTLMLPADRVIWALLVVTIVLVSVLAAVKLCAKDLVGVAFSITLPLSGQTSLFGNNAETELKVWYSAWILLTFLLGTEYTNVVQSLTTVPKRTPGKLTFRELMEKNFTIGDISQTDYNRVWGGRVFSTAFSDSRIQSRSGLFRLEEKLLPHLRVCQGGVLSTVYVQSFYKEIRTMGIVHESVRDLNIPLIAALAGRKIHESPDVLFSTAAWWVFNFLPNTDVLAIKFGCIFQSGLYRYWSSVEKNRLTHELVKMRTRTLEFMMKTSDFVWATGFDGTLADSMIRESFCLLIYGIMIATLVCAFEYFFGGKQPCVAVYWQN